MNWHPLIMCAEMALAYREGKKRQTRRILLPQPTGIVSLVSPGVWYDNGGGGRLYRAPIQPGDGVWIREPIYHCSASWSAHGAHAAYRSDGFGTDMLWRWKPSSLSGRYMPKRLCRTLGICKDVRVERVQDISEEDAKAEGVSDPPLSHRHHFSLLWDSLHGKKPGEDWDSNPWVFVYYLSAPITTDHAEAQRMLSEAK